MHSLIPFSFIQVQLTSTGMWQTQAKKLLKPMKILVLRVSPKSTTTIRSLDTRLWLWVLPSEMMVRAFSILTVFSPFPFFSTYIRVLQKVCGKSLSLKIVGKDYVFNAPKHSCTNVL